ncbi:MAG: hypothetical protein WAV11_02955 [Minisyncoccia bacterium]
MSRQNKNQTNTGRFEGGGDNTPILLTRVEKKAFAGGPTLCDHMTIVTTPGFTPEMNDQQEDATRYDKD